MSLQSCGINVVDKTSIISSTVPTSAGSSIIDTSCRSNQEQGQGSRSDGGGGDGEGGGHIRIHSLQKQQQQSHIIEWNENDTTFLPQQTSSSSTICNNNNRMRQHQCTILSSNFLVGNLTVFSKQRPISFNAKNLPYLTATTKNQTQRSIAVQKIINVPLKDPVTNILIKSSLTVTPSQLHHHHVKNSSNLQNIAPVMPKVTAIPRNVQVVTRVQTSSSTSQCQHQEQQQRQQQHYQQVQQANVFINQMKIMHNKDAQNIVSSSPSSSSSTGKQSTKIVTDQQSYQKLNAENSATSMQSLKLFSGGQQNNTQYQQAIASSGGGASAQIPTIRGNKINSTITLTMQQHQLQQTAINAAGTYTINSNKINNITIPIQQQQNSGTLTTSTIDGNNIKNAKYLLQNHIMLPGNAANTPSSTVQQNLNISGGNNSTIQFVNAHDAAVLQSQPQSVAIGEPTILQHVSFQHGQQIKKLKNNNHHQQMAQNIHISAGDQQHSTSFIDETKVVPVPVYLPTFVNNNSTVTAAAAAGLTGSCITSTCGNTNENCMIINGTPMTDEISAKILQDLSHKSIFNNNNNNNQKHQQQQQQIQHKIIGSSLTSTISSQHQMNLILCPNVARNYPLYNSINPAHINQHQRQHHRQAISRSQSLDRKSQKSQSAIMKRSSSYIELFRIRGDNTPATQKAQHEDDIIGEEVRPVPVIANDIRLQSLHAILQDHTYVTSMSNRLPLELQSESNTIVSGNNSNNIVGASISSCDVDVGGITVPTLSNTTNLIGHHTQMSTTTITSGDNNTSCDPITSEQIAHRHHQHDDDANSGISNESKTGLSLDNDLDEETESAPEAKGEDDSTTRCICDFTHDDGYMICCDKCFAWQHIVCMGIDRQNIPDEYLCELCQPRKVDRVQARNLQLIKRKEQELINAQLNTGNIAAGVEMTSDAQIIPANQKSDRIEQLPVNKNNKNNQTNQKVGKKGKLLSSTSKKKDLLKNNKKEKANSKKRECKRTVTKRKPKSCSNSESIQNERYASNLRQWIENYEIAITNHYSPELRARLHAISKQQNLLQQINATENKVLKTFGNNIENKCTTVPHAGGKILISYLDIKPNSPIVELRGKYMLTTQYKNQNPSINMNGTPAKCLQLVKNQKTPGPFIFFYQLYLDGGVGPEICVDTRTYGNEARFVRRSCRPNAEIQHTFKKGTIHLYLVSLSNIMASTEITIRHEPHDILALERKKTINFLIAPTSTMCACGLTKDCAFSCVQTMGNTKTGRKINVNGCLNKVKATNGKRSSPSCRRSTSSSGESNIGLISPSTNFTQNTYGSSSSPSVSIPSSIYSQAINSPPQQINQQQQQVPTILQQQTPEPISPMLNAPTSPQILPSNIVATIKSPQKLVTVNRKTPAKSKQNISEDSNIINPAEGGKAGGQTQTKGKRESRKLTREERKMQAIVRAFEKMEKNQQRKQELKQAEPSISKRPNSSSPSPTKQELKQAEPSIAKRRNSSSPSPKRLKFQNSYESNNADNAILSSTTQLAPAPPHKNAVLSVSRKKKRKGSKSYQTQDSSQRKKRRSRMNSNVCDVITSEVSASLLSPPISSSGPSNLSSNMSLQTATTENQITLRTNLIENQIEKPTTTTTTIQSINQNAAELLLALSSNNENQSKTKYCTREQTIRINSADIDDPDSTTAEIAEQRIPQAPETPPIVSSTCLLVEAAVEHLENYESINSGDFKLPVKIKGKKSIVNQSNYFQQTEDEESQQLETQIVQNSSSAGAPSALCPQYQAKGLDTLVQAAATMYEYQCSASSPASFMVMSSSNDKPQNLNMLSKKIQEFIDQSDASFNCGDETAMKIESTSEQSFNALSLPRNSSLNTWESSSVKKRWLRRAISEEIDEIAAAKWPASLPTTQDNDVTTPNCFRTALKKRRRLVQQCNEDEQGNNTNSDYSLNNDDPTILTIESIKTETQPGKETHEILVKVEKDGSQIKDAEAVNVEEDVDIITLPSPGDKIVADDNYVKIEPEDLSNEIEVNVEKKESCSGDLVKNDMDMFATTRTTNEEADYVKLKETVPEEEQVKMENPKEEAEEIQNESESLVSLNLPISTEKPLIDSSSNSSISCNKVIKSDTENYKSISYEIVDIQKRLNLFHKENLKILQSRNRKSMIARSLKLALSKSDIPTRESPLATKQQQTPAATVCIKLKRSPPETEFRIKSMKKKQKLTRHHNSKKRRLNFDSVEKVEGKYKLKNEIKKQKDEEDLHKLEYRKKIKDEIFRIDDKQLQAALTIPNFNHNIFSQSNPSNSIYSYVTNISALSNITYDITSLLLAPPPPPPPPPPASQPPSLPLSTSLSAVQSPSVVQNIFPVAGGYITNYSNNVTPSPTLTLQPPPLYLPYYNTIYGKFIEKNVGSSSSSTAVSSSSLNLGIPSSTITTSNHQLSDYLDTKLKSYNSTLGGYVSHSPLFGLNNSKSNISSSISSGGLSTGTVTPTLSSLDSSMSSAPPNSKFLTKTAVADPRLNPILTAPEPPPPPPKRKLSINEYRKRKQQSTEKVTTPTDSQTAAAIPEYSSKLD